jgi:hypothetical protein
VTAQTTHREPTTKDDIRPGDSVTILLYSDRWTRTSTVDSDGSYVGCGAVQKGRAKVVAVRRWNSS